MFVYELGQKKRRLRIDDFNNRFCCLLFRRKLQHDLSTANSDMFLVEGIKGLLAFFADVDEICVAQNSEMMRDGGLRKADLFNDLVDRQPATTALAHDLLAGVIGNGFGKDDWVEFHVETFDVFII